MPLEMLNLKQIYSRPNFKWEIRTRFRDHTNPGSTVISDWENCPCLNSIFILVFDISWQHTFGIIEWRIQLKPPVRNHEKNLHMWSDIHILIRMQKYAKNFKFYFWEKTFDYLSYNMKYLQSEYVKSQTFIHKDPGWKLSFSFHAIIFFFALA